MYDKHSDSCWHCGHLQKQHSGEYRGWDKRTRSYEPVKRPGTGCLVEGCECRTWFEQVPHTKAKEEQHLDIRVDGIDGPWDLVASDKGGTYVERWAGSLARLYIGRRRVTVNGMPLDPLPKWEPPRYE